MGKMDKMTEYVVGRDAQGGPKVVTLEVNSRWCKEPANPVRRTF